MRWYRSLWAAGMVVLGLSLVGPVQAAGAADRLPDLGMGRLQNFYIDTSTIPGHRLLRYATVIANVGNGPFEVHGFRPNQATALMSTTQRIYDDAGGYRTIATPATMFFAGDGHSHWHVTDLETSNLTRLSDGTVMAVWAKHGFCFYDNVKYRLTLPGAPGTAVYRGCGTESSLSVVTGLSVGWGDRYRSSRAFQYIDVTSLPTGQYRLWARADESNWFLESDETNNVTWTDLSIRGTTVRVLGRGPAA